MSEVAVIIPCHNASDYIGEALRSVASQTLRPENVIIIDDASCDDSGSIAMSMGKELDLNVNLITVNLRNAAAARNAGLASARGKWIAFLDADDVWYPNHLANALSLLNGSNDVAYMANHHWLRGGQVEAIPDSLQPKIYQDARGLAPTHFTDLMSLGFHFGHSTVLYQLDRVRKVAGFDDTQIRRHDIDLWLRVVSKSTWAWGSEPAACYRVDTPGSISKNMIEAEYFYLRALVRNSPAFSGVAMQSLVNTCARRATSLAFTDGTWEQYCKVKPLAWPYLTPGFRMSYAAAERCPAVLRQGIRIKRKLLSIASCRR